MTEAQYNEEHEGITTTEIAKPGKVSTNVDTIWLLIFLDYHNHSEETLNKCANSKMTHTGIQTLFRHKTSVRHTC